jgi:hypothetical protein
MNSTAPDLLASFPGNDLGLEEHFFGQHLSPVQLDAEFLTRIDGPRLKDLAAFNGMAWYGYRWAHPGLRVYLFAHYYQKAYRRTAKMIGRRHAKPAFMNSDPFVNARKADVTGFVTAALTADAHAIPYDVWCDWMMEQSLRHELVRPLAPTQMYHERMVSHVLDKWKERNETGIYLARAPQLRAENYEAHPWQDAYNDWLCERIMGKGNRAFWLGRVMHSNGQLPRQYAIQRFGEEIVADADYHK